MRVTIYPGGLSGTVHAVASKSDAHRKLICAALSDRETQLIMGTRSLDIEATMRCLLALGAGIRETGQGLIVTPLWDQLPRDAVLDCGESGSTLRFLLPLAPALGVRARYEVHGRLGERPNAALIGALQANGARFDRETPPMAVFGRLRGGAYALPGDVSSQYFSGLLMALPLLAEPSEIRCLSALESKGYVDLTLEALDAFGVEIKRTKRGYRVPAPQRYVSPGAVTVDGDWSNAAFFLAANALGSEVRVEGLNPGSAQGDREIGELLAAFTASGAPRGIDIDARGIPDLVPVLAVVGAVAGGTTRIHGAARLRLKESDRLVAMRACLNALGADIEETEDGLIVRGGRLAGGTVWCFNDHRIAMAMAVAATACDGPVVIEGAEAVRKSYPGFFQDFERLGGRIHVEHDRD